MTDVNGRRLNTGPVLKAKPLGLLFAYPTITATIEGFTATRWLA